MRLTAAARRASSRLAAVLLATVVSGVLPAASASASEDGAGVGVVDQGSGRWYLQDPVSGETTSFIYGNPGDLPFMGDWNCDGVDTPGLYRQADGYVYLRNSNTQGVADLSFYFGNPGDVPLAGDFDGDGCDTVSIYRPVEGTFYVVNQLGSGGAGLGAAEHRYSFGNIGDQPLAGDFDGDGVDTVGVFRPGVGQVHLKNTHTPGITAVSYSFGDAWDTAVVGAWSGGADHLGVFRPSQGMFFLANASRNILSQRAYGNEALFPIAGEFGALPGGAAPPPAQAPYPNVGSGKRIIYSNTDQRVWLIEEDGTLAKTHLVSGRAGVPAVGTYSVFSKSLKAYAAYGGITMTHMVRFAHGIRLPYGFHAIPRWPDGRPMQTVDELGTYQSAGCVRQEDGDAVLLYGWAEVGTTVHVLP